jgi:iron complex outermembrane recepter protein
MSRYILARGASAAALTLALFQGSALAQESLPTIDIGAAPASAPSAPTSAAPAAEEADALAHPPGFTPERMKLPVYRDPPGQTETTIQTRHFQNESLQTVGDLLEYSPGVTINQGNSARDIVIQIRGSGARTTTGLSNIVVQEDGFNLTLPNGGGGYTLALDPHAYGAVDVYRGASSALWGNYAMEGAVNFRMRNGADINGVELGSEYGSFGSVQNWAIGGKKIGDFDLSLFASDVRGDGYINHTGYNTQTLDFKGTWSPTTTDRLTLKALQNDWFSYMGGRESWTQYMLNPWQRGYGCNYLTALNAPFCVAVQGAPVPANGIGGKPAPSESPAEVGMHRHNTRDFVGLRYEHDFDNLTTWRSQASWDYNDYEQPTNPAWQSRGPVVAVNADTDITSHAPLFGMPATHYLGFIYNNAHQTQNSWFVIPFNFNQGAVGAQAAALNTFQSDMGLRAREELAITKELTGVVGFSSTWTKIYGVSDSYSYTKSLIVPQLGSPEIRDAQSYWNYAPEAALAWRINPEWQMRARYETAYATPSASSLFTTSAGVPGDNTSLKSQTSQGFDLGADWTPAGRNFTANVTLFNEWWRNEFLSQLAANAVSYTSNIPASIHRGVEASVEWRPVEGWRLVGNYTFNDQFFQNLQDTVSGSTTTTVKGVSTTTTTILPIQRAGLKLPGVPSNVFTGRIAYDQPFGDFKGLGGFVEYQYRGDSPLDNANLLWAPGYGIVNADIHYTRDLDNGEIKKFTIYFGVKNIFDRTYISSFPVVTDALFGAKNLLQQPAAALSNSANVIPGSPRAFYVGARVKF